VSLSWSAPSENGGSAITDYVVQYSSNSGSSWTTFSDGTSTSTTATITDLSNGTAYIFQVAAVNAAGTGSYSTPSSSVTPYTTPGAPTGVVGTAGSSQVSLSWTAPSDNGGALITDYAIQYSSNGGGTWIPFTDGESANTSTVVTGLANGTEYTFQVAAINAAGTGTYSASSLGVTPVTTPGAPTSVIETPGDGQVSLSWTAPSSNGGSAITDYVVQYSSNSGGTWTTFADGTSTNTTATVTGLSNGTAYDFQVAAVNASGTGAYSVSSSPLPNVTISDAPTNVVATAGNGVVSIVFSPPNYTGGCSITDYYFIFSTDNGQTWSALSTSLGTLFIPSFKVTVTNGKTYQFKLAARNLVGLGTFSASSNSVTPKAP
jgi:predicted phage tail protein